jgi:hypothetical protein
MAFRISAATWLCKATSQSIRISNMVLLMIGPYLYSVKGRPLSSITPGHVRR